MPGRPTRTHLGQTEGAGTKTFGGARETGSYRSHVSLFSDLLDKSGTIQAFGGFRSLSSADPLDSGNDIVVTAGTGRLLLVLNAGSDFSGTITVTGTTVDRETGAETASDTEDLTVSELSTVNSTTDSNGNTVFDLEDGLITTKAFKDSVTISTSDTTFTDVDTLQIASESFNDAPLFVADTIEATFGATGNMAAVTLDMYLYSVTVRNGKASIKNDAELRAASMTTNTSFKLEKSNIGRALVGATDGVFMQIHMSTARRIEDFLLSIWVEIIGTGTDVLNIKEATVASEDDTRMLDIQNPTASENMRLLFIKDIVDIQQINASTEGASTDVTMDLVHRDWNNVYSGGTNVYTAGTFKPDTNGEEKTSGFSSIDGRTIPQVLVMTTSAITGVPTRLNAGIAYTVRKE